MACFGFPGQELLAWEWLPVLLCSSRHSRLAQWGASGVGHRHSMPGLFPSVSPGAPSHDHLLSESCLLGRTLSGAKWGEPLHFCERTMDWSPLLGAAGDGNTWHCLALCLGKSSASQHREQCENSQLCSQPHCLLRSPNSLNSESTDDSVAEETGSKFPGSIHWGSFNRDQGGVFKHLQCPL